MTPNPTPTRADVLREFAWNEDAMADEIVRLRGRYAELLRTSRALDVAQRSGEIRLTQRALLDWREALAVLREGGDDGR